jgi:hypothetical protein
VERLGKLGLYFPILRFSEVGKLVTGQTADLIFFELPTLHVGRCSASGSLYNFGIPYVAEVSVVANPFGSFEMTLNLSGGLDTSGWTPATSSMASTSAIAIPAAMVSSTRTTGARTLDLEATLGANIDASVRLLGFEVASVIGSPRSPAT